MIFQKLLNFEDIRWTNKTSSILHLSIQFSRHLLPNFFKHTRVVSNWSAPGNYPISQIVQILYWSNQMTSIIPVRNNSGGLSLRIEQTIRLVQLNLTIKKLRYTSLLKIFQIRAINYLKKLPSKRPYIFTPTLPTSFDIAQHKSIWIRHVFRYPPNSLVLHCLQILLWNLTNFRFYFFLRFFSKFFTTFSPQKKNLTLSHNFHPLTSHFPIITSSALILHHSSPPNKTTRTTHSHSNFCHSIPSTYTTHHIPSPGPIRSYKTSYSPNFFPHDLLRGVILFRSFYLPSAAKKWDCSERKFVKLSSLVGSQWLHFSYSGFLR